MNRVGPGRALRIVIGVALAVAVIVATGALTRYQHPVAADRAELRLAWRLAVPRIEECRAVTPEEQAELPVHMRQDEVCEGRSVSYRLEVRVDDELRHQATVAPEGARGDRPMQVFETLPLEPGARRVAVVFERADTAASPGEIDVPSRLVWDRRLQIDPREVVLLTYDADERRLVRRTGGLAVRAALASTRKRGTLARSRGRFAAAAANGRETRLQRSLLASR